MASTTATTWRVDLRFRGALRSLGLYPCIALGEGGDVVVPGVGEAQLLASDTRLRAVPGLELLVGDDWAAIPSAGIELAPGEWVKLRVAAHPEIELVVGRERVEPVPISRVPMLPWREAVYGLAFAACMASLISVKVAASPVRQRDAEDRELAQELLVDVPVAFVMPAPPIEVPLPPADAVNAVEPRDTIVDDGLAEVEPVSEIAQLDPVAKPKPKPRKRRVEEAENVYGGLIGEEIGTAALVGVLTTSDEHFAILDEVRGDVVPMELSTARKEVTPPAPLAVEPIAGTKAEAATRAEVDTEGVAAKATCELEYDAKDRLDVVFVVDASAPMAKVLATLADRVPELHRRVADKQVRYGLVAFADDVELVRLDALTKDEVRVALLGLSADAETREPDADVRDDVLGALDRASEFQWGETRDTLRMMVLVTDNDFGDRGDRLGDHEVKRTYARVVDELADESIRVTTVTRRKVPGLDEGRDGHPSLPAATGGIALRESTLYPTDGLADAMRDLLRNPVCRKNIVDVLIRPEGS